MDRRWFAAATLLGVLAGCAESDSSTHAAPWASAPAGASARTLLALPRTAGAWPGVNGLSGANGDPVLDKAHVESFCTARGRPCRVAQTYTDRTSYASMTSGTSWTFEFFAGFDGVLVISQGLVPEDGAGELAACASGDHDDQWRDFGTLMVRHGRGDSIVRLGWEFNEATMPWRGLDAATYIACFRHATDAIRATDPQVLIDWTINAHHTPADLCGGLSTTCYPGDAYVDIIGIDNYDHYPWSPTRAAFVQTAAQPEGLTWLYDYAQRHHKPFSVGEWGVVPTGDAGRENPDFITWMHDWFAAHAASLAYETYFSDCTSGGVQSSLFNTSADCRRNPASAARYRALFTE
jgi:hypothetical protein